MGYGEITKKDIELIDNYVKECGAYLDEGRAWFRIKMFLLSIIETDSITETEETNNAN